MKNLESLTMMLAGSCLLLLTACSRQSHWTEAQRKSFQEECSRTDHLQNLTLTLAGFAPGEIDSLRVQEYQGDSVIAGFAVAVEKSPADSGVNPEASLRFVTIHRVFDLKHGYRISIPGQAPYELTRMKTVMWPQYTMNSEGWGCVMGDFTLDGTRYERNANPTLRKR